MMLRQALSRAGLALLLLASLAMSASAFAHRTTQPDPDLLAYISMGGTLAELCGEDNLAHHLIAGCEACRISANALAADATAHTLAPVVYGLIQQNETSEAAPAPRHAHLTPPSRAPPPL